MKAPQSAFTPGPWHVSALDGRTCGPSRLLVLSGTTVPQLQAVAIVTLRTGETDANARLIAAAPDLLAALKDLYPLVEDCWDGPAWTCLRIIEAAIAKAEGPLEAAPAAAEADS
jgi:hypothetical protein